MRDLRQHPPLVRIVLLIIQSFSRKDNRDATSLLYLDPKCLINRFVAATQKPPNGVVE